MRYSGPCLNMGNWSTSLERTRGEKKSRFRRRAPHKDTRAVCRREKMRENWGRNLLPWHWRIPLTRVSFPTVKCSRDSIQFPLKRKKIATGRLFRHHGKPKKDSSQKWPFYPLDSSPRNFVFSFYSTLFYICSSVFIPITSERN